MIAYKFLAEGRVGPFTGFRWPAGEWVEAAAVRRCRAGVHACRPDQLPYWLGPELWELELDGEIVEHALKIVAPRGRLVRRRDEWTPALRDDFVADLVASARSRFGSRPALSGYIADIERFQGERRTALAAFAAARAAEHGGGRRAYEAERARQAQWLARRLGLDAP